MKIIEEIKESIREAKNAQELNEIINCINQKKINKKIKFDAIENKKTKITSYIHSRDGHIEVSVSCWLSLSFLLSKNLIDILDYLQVKDHVIEPIGGREMKERKEFFRKYNIKEGHLEENSFDIIKGNIIFKGKKIKSGKFIRALFPKMDNKTISDIVDIIKASFLNIEFKSSKEITKIYNSKNLKIYSCMRGKDMSILEEAGFKVLYLKDARNNIIARVLVFENYFSEIYSTTYALEQKIKIELKEKGFTQLYENNEVTEEVRTKEIKGRPEDYYIPYMDIMQFVHLTENGFYFSNREEGHYKIARTTKGIVDKEEE